MVRQRIGAVKRAKRIKEFKGKCSPAQVKPRREVLRKKKFDPLIELGCIMGWIQIATGL